MNKYEKAECAYIEACRGINIKENEKIVLECKTGWSYYFANYIEGANIKDHEKIILDLKDPILSFCFAKDILGANIEEHFKVIVNSGHKGWLDFFIEQVNYKNTRVEDWLLYI